MAEEKKERKKGPHDGHKDRMRKRFIHNKGFNGFSDHEILEMLLNYTIVRKNTNEIAHDLISTFGSLEAVFEADIEELVKVKDVGPRTAVLICTQKELLRLYGERRFGMNSNKPRFDDENYIKTAFNSYMSTLYAGVTDERCYMMFINAKGRMSKAMLLCEGSGECIIVNQKKLLKEAINNNASSVVLVHNHLTGISLPSNADIETTKKISAVLEAVGIDLCDHYIYTENGCTSILGDVRFKYGK